MHQLNFNENKTETCPGAPTVTSTRILKVIQKLENNTSKEKSTTQ